MDCSGGFQGHEGMYSIYVHASDPAYKFRREELASELFVGRGLPSKPVNFLPHSHSIPVRCSQSRNLAISQSRNLAISQSRNLATSQSRNLAISQSRNLAISQSRNLAILDSCRFGVQVGWGQLSIVDAERRLLAWALLDLKNSFFVILSEK